MSNKQLPPGHPLAKQSGPVTWSEFKPQIEDSRAPYNLASLFFNDTIQYKCGCGSYRRLNTTYFCRYCLELRCRSCVAHEVESQYCQHCLEYIPTIDPKFQMNKCASCHQCPNCQHLLSTSILAISPTTNEPQQPVPQHTDEVVKKTCQLVCEFCRWSSGTFITEGSRITNSLADIEVKNASRISELVSYYKVTSQKERADKKKRRFHSRSGNTMDLLKKYGIDNTLSPKLFESLRARSNFHDKTSSSGKFTLEPKSTEETAIGEFKPAESLGANDLEKLDTDFYYKNDFDLEQIASIEQRLAQVELQPEKTVDFKPISKSLSVKRSLRCKNCERNLCRSEYSPVSIKFKIQSAAYYYIPELKLRSETYPLKLNVDRDHIVEFTLQNQTNLSVKLKLDQIFEDEEQTDVCELRLPPYELTIGPKDDTIEYDHLPLNIRPLNEDTQVIFQSPLKIGFFIKVRPKKVVPNLSIKFLLSHDVTVPQNPRENEKIERVSHVIQVALGPVE